ncbi:MAG TPA: carboxypeptidase regulatory-like domain-containing protein [Gemmatimonadales bacterium]|nr:carboxypeptidase regulatory-like domain-containing protein [Gemmatimonadales bacterium]
MAALLALARPVAAQPSAEPAVPPPTGSVSGTVLSAETGQPLVGAVAVLEVAGRDGAALLARADGPFFARALTAVTDDSGGYRFSGLPAGTYRLLVRQLGYRPAVVTVELARDTPFRVSVGLVMNPIRLEAIEARAPTADPYGLGRDARTEQQRGSLDAEQWRHDRFVEGDAAVLTHANVVGAVTLGETDLFRAMQRLPGVSARDDYMAGLWTRGAPWSQTRVYFDGLPLFNPVHAVGLFAGVNPDAVGVAAFLPGARPASVGEGAAGVVEIESRAAAPGARGLGELSLVSARGAADWGAANGRAGLTVAVRRSWADLATRLAQAFGADTGTFIPYHFTDLTARLNADLGGGAALEASGLMEEDQVHGQVRQLLRATGGTWGNQLGRVSLLAPLAAWRARYTVGASRFDGTIGPIAGVPASPAGEVPVHGPTRNGVTVLTGAVDLAPPASGGGDWSLGLETSAISQRYVGQWPRPYPVVVLPDTLLLRRSLAVLAGWAQRRQKVGGAVTVEAGLRAEAHAPVLNAGPVSVAPRIALRVEPARLPLTFTAAAQRSWQYTQALAPAGPSVGPDLYLTDVWLLAADTVPALRADVATAGVEARVGGAWVAALNGYVRHTTGMAVPEPGPGPLTASRPILVSAVNDASGLELSVRRLAGRWTVSGSYSLGRSDLAARSAMFPVWYRYPSPADRRHVVNLTAMLRISPALRLGAAATWASGAPFSRFLLGQCPTCATSDSAAVYIESPNAVRGPAYASLDLLVDWSRTVGKVTVGAFAQVRNVLGRANAVTYTGSVAPCAPRPPTLVDAGGGVCDRFDRGVPLLPLAGLSVAF